MADRGNAIPDPSRRFSGTSMIGHGYPIPEPSGHFSDPVLDAESTENSRSAYSGATSTMQVNPGSTYAGDFRTPSEGHADEHGPTWVGAFTTLIQRITPIEDLPVQKVEHSMGRLGQDVGREREMVEGSPPAATWASSPLQSPRQSPMDSTSDDRLPSILPPPASDTSLGWAYGGWGWNSLFGTSNENKDTILNDGYQLNTHAHENIETAKLSYNADTFAVDRIGPPAVPVDSVNRNLFDDYDKHRWPARNQGSDGYGMNENKFKMPNKYDEWMENAKAALPKLPTDLRYLEFREGCIFCGQLFMNCPSRYTAAGPARCPCVCASIYTLIFLLTMIIGIAVGPMEIETDFGAFMKTDVNSSILWDTFKEAKNSRSSERRLQAALFLKHDIYIGYEMTAETSGSVLDVLQGIAGFERSLLALPGWSTLCNRVATIELGADVADLPRLCNPGISLAHFALPSRQINMTDSIIPTKMTFDGAGYELLPSDSTLRLVEQLGVEPIVFPIGFQKNNVGNTRILRSVFRFEEYCCSSASSQGERTPIIKRAKEEWEEFIRETVLPFLQERAEKQKEYGSFLIFFDGTGFRDIEVKKTLMNDTWLAAGSLTVVLFYMLFHTQSVFLSFVGLVIVFLAVPFSYVVFAILAGTRTMNIASFLSLFLVIGLGSDVVFVYTDFWREALRVKESVVDRLTYTLQRGGKASLATTVTTALSFFANLASVLRPLREFGFFMGLCVTFVWVMISLIFVPLCAVDATYFQSCSLIRLYGRRQKESSWQRYFCKLTTGVQRWRRLLLVGAVLEMITFSIFVILLAETDGGVPNIFPTDHNQNRGKELLERFHPIKEVMDTLFYAPKTDIYEDICHEYDFNDNDHTDCLLFWCEVEADIPKSTAEDCRCYQKYRPSCGGGPGSVELRVVGANSLSSGVVQENIMQSLPRSVSVLTPSLQTLAPIYLSEWETGIDELVPLQHAKASLQTSVLCGWDQLCFCNTHICKLPSGWNLMNYTLPNNGTSSSSRLLSATVWSIAPPQRAIVSVVFGVDVKLESPLLGELEPADMWSFFSSFDMSQPWSQRNIYEMCTSAPANLRVAATNCWIIDFRQYLAIRDKRFPVQKNNFQVLVTQFLVDGLTNFRSSKDFLWLRDGGTIKGCFIDFFVDVHKNEKSDAAIDYMSKWNKFMDNWNDEASRATRGAWHTSELWVRAEAQEELISSTIATLVIVICLAFVGMLVFTFDILLSIYVVLSTLLVLTGLAFFIVVVMSWEIGPIEVIALIIFIGYAVTYSLHIAHKYGSSDALELTSPPDGHWDELSRIRFQRTQFALKSIGSAALGSAATTTGCSIFLLFCTLTIFQKLGGVVLVVTLLSIYTAFFNLPALLLMIGPTRPGQYYWLLLPCLSWRTHIDRLRGFFLGGPRQETKLALESSPSQQMVPEQEPWSPPDVFHLPAKQMHVRVLHTTQVPKPLGMRPSVESLPPLVLESDGNVGTLHQIALFKGFCQVRIGIDRDIVHKGKVVGISGNVIHQGAGVQSTQREESHAEMDDMHLRGFAIGEESTRQPIQAGAVVHTSSANMLTTGRWQGTPPKLGNPQDFTSRLPLQNQQGPSSDSQKLAAKNKVKYSLPRRERFNNRNNGSRANTPQGNGFGPSNAPWQRPQGQLVGRGSIGNGLSQLPGIRLPSAP